MVAPEELHETSCDPKTKRFTVIRRVKDRKSNVLKDENIPHVKIVDKKLTVINYAPTSLYTARTLARSQQSHQFVRESETKVIRRQKQRKKQTKKMRKE